MTQLDLGSGLVTPSMISQIESDRATPSPKLIEELAHRLGVDPTHFYDDIHQKNDQVQAYRRAKSLMDLNQFEAALPLLQSLVSPLTPQFREEVLYSDLADCLRQLGRFTEAADMYERVVRIALEKDDVASAVRGCYHQGLVYRRAGQLGMARMFWQRASHMLERHPELNMPLAMRIESSLGQACLHLNLYEQASTSYERAAAFARQYQSVIDIAITHHGLAGVYMSTGEMNKAEAATEAALEAYHSAQRLRGILQCSVNKAQIMRMKGQHEASIRYLTQLLSNNEVQRDSEVSAHALYERALNFVKLNQLDRATSDCTAALLCDKDSDANRRAVHLLLAEVYSMQAQWPLVIEHAKAAERIDCAEVGQKLHLYGLMRRAAIEVGQHHIAIESALATATIALKLQPV